ncbi:MAG: hypothetical protein JSU81_11385 [Candidatus Coatesbacteria bacterium]|nr:MAG: hypothetical protein JSU81_11385 [Candidatus Coatesbacteria bacterium]
MKTVFIIAMATTLAASAGAGTLPNAADEHVMRFGPLASAVFEANVFYEDPYVPWASPRAKSETRWGGGVGVWGQYDRTWIGCAMRFGATMGDFGGMSTVIDWENEYYIYLLKHRLRPFLMPLFGFGHTQSERGGDPRLPVGLYVGARWAGVDSPRYLTASVGGKYVFLSDDEWGGWVAFRGRGYFGLTDTVALYAGIDFGRGFVNDYYGSEYAVWRGRFYVGPSWAF